MFSLDVVNLIDLECSCWDDPNGRAQNQQEIIEIGIWEYHVNERTLLNGKGILIHNTESPISEFCTGLTSITQNQLDREGVSFEKATSILLREYKSRQRNWASWGNFDLRIFKEQYRRRRIRYPLGPCHLNVKTLYSLMRRHKREYGIDEALKLEGMEFEGNHHRGVDDVKNFGRIVRVML